MQTEGLYGTDPLFRRSVIPKVHHTEGPCVRSHWSGSQGAKPSEAENLLAFRCRKEAKNLVLGGLPIDAMYISAACV